MTKRLNYNPRDEPLSLPRQARPPRNHVIRGEAVWHRAESHPGISTAHHHIQKRKEAKLQKMAAFNILSRADKIIYRNLSVACRAHVNVASRSVNKVGDI